MTTEFWKSPVSSDWDVIGNWSSGAPTAADAVFVTVAGSYDITIGAGEAVSIDSLSQTAGELSVDGNLTLDVANAQSVIGPAATLDGMPDNDGFNVYDQGTLLNLGTIRSSATSGFVDVYAQTFANTGLIAASAGSELLIESADFRMISTGTLTGGTYLAAGQASGFDSTIEFENSGTASSEITADAATITLSGPASDIIQYSDATGFVDLDQTLSTIAATGVLNVLGGRSYAAGTTLTDGGQLRFGGGVLSAAGLTVSSTGTLLGYGSVASEVIDAGIIEAQGGTLTLAGGVTGSGVVQIDADANLAIAGSLGNRLIDNGTVALQGDHLLVSGSVSGSGGFLLQAGSVDGVTTLELSGADTADIAFGGDYAMLSLDLPLAFAGTIMEFAAGDTLVLAGIVGDAATLVGNTLDITSQGSVVAGLAMSNLAAGTSFATSSGAGGTTITAQGTGITFNFVYDASVANAPAQFKQALTLAAESLGALIRDPITVNIAVGWGENGGQAIGDSLATGGPGALSNVTYAQFKSDFTEAATSPTDIIAAASLPSSDPTDGNGIFLASAQEKAWGLLPADASAIDGSVGFSTTASFDYGTTTPTGGSIDFIGVAEHELTHAIGRTVDESALSLFDYAAPGTLQSESLAGGYFSIDGGTTALGTFDTTSDPSDWAAGTGPDSFDAYSVDDVINPITPADDAVLDVLGYDLACFAAGTRIRGISFDIAVEEIRPGDRLSTHLDGAAREVIWVGHRHVDCRRHPSPRTVWPVRIAAGAFGRRLPRRDLFLSPEHSVYVDGVLIPIRHLVNGSSISQHPVDAITYWHIELARHDVVLAEGLPCETYLDTGSRGFFANGGRVVPVPPDFAVHAWEALGCAPLVITGMNLERVRQRLARQVASRPARSWMNCQATRPERAPRVTDHSTAAACNSARSMASENASA
jgi:hypothetical protein